ncbi:MAG TPA: choice-of-anchor D domain-containing protein [Stellaceae bacterium]|nr:choice-of-anchor D domain-containing protein [Stellaceae bacterium]
MRIVVTAVSALACVVVSLQPASAQVQGQWTKTGSMQSAREQGSQVKLIGGNVLAVGGVDNSGNLLATAEVYSAAQRSWVATGSMAEAREAFPAVTLASGKVLVSGGLGTGSAVLGGAELYDPATQAWTPAGTLAVARFGHTATLLSDGEVLVSGGCTAAGCSTTTAASEIYDPATNSWSPTGALNTARTYHTAVRLKNGEVLAVGGLAGGATSSSELYSPATGTWRPAAGTNVARYLNGTTLLPDGKVLVTGGVITRYPLNSAELYNPATNTWTLTGNMSTGRYAHTSTLLTDGTVLLAGGEGQSISCGKACTGYIPTAKAELFNESAGTFAATTGLARALAYHETTLLGNGRALTAGGTGYNVYCCTVVSDAEYYTPLTMTFSATSLNFGLLEIGLTTGPQTIAVTNVSNHSTTFTSIASSGDFEQTNTCPQTLNSGQACTIAVTFAPTGAGVRTGAVTLRDNDPGSATQTLTLLGTGEKLALGFTPASLNLGSVQVGSTSIQTATLTNDGASAVNITGITVSPANGTFTQTNTCPATLAVQQSCTMQIVFTPPDVFAYAATLSVTNSAGSAATLHLSGTGLDGG